MPGIQEAALADDKRIACLGDFWSIRYQINVSLLNRVIEVLEGWDRLGLHTTFLPGNHDQVAPTGENALEVLARLNGEATTVQIVDHIQAAYPELFPTRTLASRFVQDLIDQYGL